MIQTKEELFIAELGGNTNQEIELSYGAKIKITDLLSKYLKAINYTHCCEELNPEFAIGEQVLLTKRTVVTIETFCEDGMIEIDDNNEYYKVDKDELSKRV